MAKEPEQRGLVKYESRGQEIVLTVAIVREFLVTGQKELVTDQEIYYFLGICKARQLNPFTKDCYLIKYGSDPAAIITAIDFYRSRARAQKDCVGWQSGVICLQKDGTLRYSKGIVLPNEELVGGWFRARPQGWEVDFELEVNLSGYIKTTRDGKVTKFWQPANQPSQIKKVAESQGLRTVWPDLFQGTITGEEAGVDILNIDISAGVSGDSATPPADPPDTSQFDSLVEAKLKELSPEEATTRAKHLGQFLAETAELMSTKKAPVTIEMLMVSGGSHFEPYTDKKGKLQMGFWKKFLAWEALPDRPWNPTGTQEAPVPPLAAEAGPAEKAESAAGESNEDPWPETEGETFEQRVDRLWVLVTQKSPSLKDMKEACGVTNKKSINPENIEVFDTFITGYEKG